MAGVDQLIEQEVMQFRDALDVALQALHDEYDGEPQRRDEPFVMAASAVMERHYEDLGKTLLAATEAEPDPDYADAQVLRALSAEYYTLLRRLNDLPSRAGDASITQTAIDHLDQVRREIDGLAFVPRVQRRRGTAQSFEQGLHGTSEAAPTRHAVSSKTLEPNWKMYFDGHDTPQPMLWDNPAPEDDKPQGRPDPARGNNEVQVDIARSAGFPAGASGAAASAGTAASAWTGRRSPLEQARVVKSLAPRALNELDQVIAAMEQQRFNDALAAETLEALRQLHDAIGLLLAAANAKRPLDAAVSALGGHKDRLAQLLKHGAKVAIVAPAWTFGISHLLAMLMDTEVDTALVAGVYAAFIAEEFARAASKK